MQTKVHSSEAIRRAACTWDEHTKRFANRNSGLHWWEVADLERLISRRISGDADVDWVTYSVDKFLSDRKPLYRILSLGCGTGHLERRLAQIGAFEACEAYDISEGSIALAQERADAEGLTGIRYHVADVNELSLPSKTYDAAFVAGAMHHFTNLERIAAQLRKTLTGGGLLILNEYIGPDRFYFPDRQKELANLCLLLLPSRFRMLAPEAVDIQLERNPWDRGLAWTARRLTDKIRSRDLGPTLMRRFQTYKARLARQPLEKRGIVFPKPEDVVEADPSEAVRSSEIISTIEREFEIVERIDWGGNIFQFLLAGIAGNFREGDATSGIFLKMLLDIEEALLRSGELKSDYSFIVAKAR